MNNNLQEQKFTKYINEIVLTFSFIQKEINFGNPNIYQSNEGMSDDCISIRYESEFIFLEIFYSNMEGEVSVDIGLINQQYDEIGRPISIKLEEALFFCGTDIELPIHTHIRSETHFKNVIETLALIIQSNLQDALKNQKIILKWLELKKEKEREHKQEASLIIRREEAQKAWEEKEYKKVISLYLEFKEHLNELERKRLHYAKKHNYLFYMLLYTLKKIFHG